MIGKLITTIFVRRYTAPHQPGSAHPPSPSQHVPPAARPMRAPARRAFLFRRRRRLHRAAHRRRALLVHELAAKARAALRLGLRQALSAAAAHLFRLLRQRAVQALRDRISVVQVLRVQRAEQLAKARDVESKQKNSEQTKE